MMTIVFLRASNVLFPETEPSRSATPHQNSTKLFPENVHDYKSSPSRPNSTTICQLVRLADLPLLTTCGSFSSLCNWLPVFTPSAEPFESFPNFTQSPYLPAPTPRRSLSGSPSPHPSFTKRRSSNHHLSSGGGLWCGACFYIWPFTIQHIMYSFGTSPKALSCCQESTPSTLYAIHHSPT